MNDHSKSVPIDISVNSLQALPVDFYLEHTVEVAKHLLGCLVVRILDGRSYLSRIVETEAYRHDDRASHSYRGKTERCKSMFESGGIAYIYRIYGVHECFNVVTERKDRGCAVLIRAVEPLNRFDEVWKRRFPEKPFSERLLRRTTNGPGKVCSAYSITRSELDGHRLDGEPLWIARSVDFGADRFHITEDRRVGITKSIDRKWRFFITENRFVSSGRGATAPAES